MLDRGKKRERGLLKKGKLNYPDWENESSLGPASEIWFVLLAAKLSKLMTSSEMTEHLCESGSIRDIINRVSHEIISSRATRHKRA